MDTQNENITQSPTVAPVKQRSASYPSISIKKAYDFACKINAQFSASSEVTRQEIALGLKLNSGTITRDLSSCAQFGFLEKKQLKPNEEVRYKLTKIFSDIFQPESEKQKKLSFIKAFNSPKLYKDLVEKFENSLIPVEFVNTLIKHHNITEAAATEAANIFLESGKDVGVINEQNVLKYALTLSTLSKTQYAEIEDLGVNNKSDGDSEKPEESQVANEVLYVPNNNPVAQPQGVNIGNDLINIPIYLTKAKFALFGYPKNISENDIKIVEHQIEGILLRIRLEKEEEKEKGAVTPS